MVVIFRLQRAREWSRFNSEKVKPEKQEYKTLTAQKSVNIQTIISAKAIIINMVVSSSPKHYIR